MAKKDMKSRLGASMKAEMESVKSRFEKADSFLGRGEKPADVKPSHLALAPGVPATAPPQKVIRDSFTMPSDDYDLIAEIKRRCLKVGVSANKAEVLRAGLRALSRMPDESLRGAIDNLTKVKTGRPPASSAED